jgi:type IV pilus assembly protein PilA
MKNLKKNNKGFSLVELIVVVLIIAIIAVALAPQVIKWVQQARDNTKENQIATVKSAVDTVVADCLAEGKAIPTSFKVTNAGAVSNVTGSIGAASGAATSDFQSKIAVALSDLRDGKTYTVTINSSYTVSVTQD